MEQADNNRNQQTHFRKKRVYRIAMVLVVIVLLNLGGTYLGHTVNFQLFPRHDTILQGALLLAIILYVLLMTLPFMPGMEIGVAIMMLLGSKSALLVYLCTLVALSGSYLVGRLIPLRLVQRFLQWLYLERASDLVGQLEPLDQNERLNILNQKLPTRIAPFLLNHRYITIAVLFNLPGNALIGGGGGIGLIIGMSRLVPFGRYLLVMAAAVAPVPLFIYLN